MTAPRAAALHEVAVHQQTIASASNPQAILDFFETEEQARVR
jgi:hypothetical protein